MAQINHREIAKDGRIKVRGLRACLGGTEILKDLDLDIAPGEFVSIVGKSGVGKSTLLHALARFIQCEGDILTPEKIGVVFQNYAVFPWLTVEDNVGLGLVHLPLSKKIERVRCYVDLVGLAEHAAKYPAQLSGGQQQRVAIARAFAPDPQVIFCDEPFGALDLYTREKMQKWLLDVWERDKKTVLFVTHSIDEAVFLSDRVLVMGHGGFVHESHITFDRPRDESLKFSIEFSNLKKKILEHLEATN